MRDLFKPEDFDSMVFTDHTIGQVKKMFCDFANEKLNKALESATVVYGCKGRSSGKWMFGEHQENNDTHTALLIGIKPIKQKTTLEKISDVINRDIARSDMILEIKKLIEEENVSNNK